MRKRSMIVRKTYNGRKNIDNLLDQYATIYGIESLADSKLRYGVKNGLFAAMRLGDAMVCDIGDMPELAGYFRPDIRQEILDIYDDIKDLNRMQVRLPERRLT